MNDKPITTRQGNTQHISPHGYTFGFVAVLFLPSLLSGIPNRKIRELPPLPSSQGWSYTLGHLPKLLRVSQIRASWDVLVQKFRYVWSVLWKSFGKQYVNVVPCQSRVQDLVNTANNVLDSTRHP